MVTGKLGVVVVAGGSLAVVITGDLDVRADGVMADTAKADVNMMMNNAIVTLPKCRISNIFIRPSDRTARVSYLTLGIPAETCAEKTMRAQRLRRADVTMTSPKFLRNAR